MSEKTLQGFLQENKELKIFRPFGPSIGHSKLPQELIDDFNKDCESIMDDEVKKKTHDFSKSLVGQVKQQLIITPEIFDKWSSYFKNIATTYLNAQTDDAHRKTRPEVQKMIFNAAWYVRTFNGDFNPAHYHDDCHLSCVGYLSLPKGIEKEWAEEDKTASPCVGSIEMQYGQFQLFSTNTIRLRPAVGDYYIFPWWMYHMVYPFRTEGERRSFSFNVRAELEEKSPNKR
jgi:uncharacterized protein (TIGR02466 family)